jgi:hypothetical protein
MKCREREVRISDLKLNRAAFSGGHMANHLLALVVVVMLTFDELDQVVI